MRLAQGHQCIIMSFASPSSGLLDLQQHLVDPDKARGKRRVVLPHVQRLALLGLKPLSLRMSLKELG